MGIKAMLTSPTFRNKVIISTVICIILPVILTLSIYNYLTRDAIKEQAIQNANNELELTEKYVSKLLDDMLYVLNFVQLDTKLNSILKSKAQEDDNEEENYEQFLENQTVMDTISDITLLGKKSQVTILLKNGKYYTNYSVSEYDPLLIYEEDWFEQLKTLHGYESFWIETNPTVFQSEKTYNPYQISIARPLRDQRSAIYGYVIVTIFENKLSEVFENREANEEIMLVNGDGVILSHKNNNQIGQKFAYWEQNQKKNISNIIRFIDQDYLITTKELIYNNWQLVSVVPYKQAVSTINSIFSRVFFLLLISFTIFFVILAYLINRITKPLVHLGGVVEKVQKGNLAVRSRLHSSDELGRFSKSFDHMLDRINEMIKEVQETQSRKRKAELAMLQAQINPHFLFNVLNSIRIKVFRNGDKESAKMISSLSKLLRMTIESDKGNITFAEEVDIVTDYIFLMNMRQKESVTFVKNISDECYNQMIPRFVLQPIIENSLIHGFNQSKGIIKLNALMTKDNFIVEIEDNGIGMDSKKLETLQSNLGNQNHLNIKGQSIGKTGFSSIGLSNVYERLVMTFGNKFQIKVESYVEKGTRVTLMIPMERGDEDV
ncbi:sensor histidine kinase [Aquibacillus salsiterrae]|uniref:Histidine kinase n=1 Tax=Aquibacillus salsiterrae TaxID=2950439 RepID=A0A9X3WG17_9BACI|nr:sensor histidine kinase [Aquibacillus salsiterrae]MDC3416779.1 histidine kinase [Aquibacillus salsiterrae]